MVEQKQDIQQQTMALGRPPMPGLLEDMKMQKTLKPTTDESTAAATADTSSTAAFADTEWYKRSHSADRIDVRKSGFQEAKQELQNLLFGEKVQQEPASELLNIPQAPPMPPSSRTHMYGRRTMEPKFAGGTVPGVSGRYTVEGDTLLFSDGMRERKGIPRTMRAAVIDTFDEANPSESLAMSRDFVLPPRMELGADEVMIQVQYCALNNEDHKAASGLFKSSMSTHLPFIPGRDGVGKIVRLGSSVQKQYGFDLGDEVMGVSTDGMWGTYGEYAVMKAYQVCLKPPSLSPRIAASLPVSLQLAFEAFNKISRYIDSTRRLLILDNGFSAGVTPMLVLLAKYYFMIERVSIACPTDNLGYFRELGADMIIDIEKETFEDVVMQYYEDEMKMLRGDYPTQTMPATTAPVTAGGPSPEAIAGKKREGAVDLVIDLVGGYDIQSRAYKLLSKRGTFIGMSFPREIERSETSAKARGGEIFGMGRHMLKHKFKSYFGGSPRYQQVIFADYDGRRLKSLVDFLIDKHLVNKLHSEEYAWEQLPQALRKLHTTPYEGKLVVRMSQQSGVTG